MPIGKQGLVLSGLAAVASLLCLAHDADADVWSETFVGCTKQVAQGAGLAISSYVCGKDQGNVHLEADPALPGFVEVQDTEDGPVRQMKIRTFKKDPQSPIDAVLDAVRAASPGPATPSCTFERAPQSEDSSAERYYLAPTGAARTAWDRAMDSDPEGDPPCGPLGVQFVGDLYFVVLPGDPGRVAFIDSGSEIQIFDPSTLRAAP